MPGITYRLLLYMAIDGNLALVDTRHSDDADELIAEAKDRKNNNPEYVAVLLSYKLVEATIVEVENTNESEQN